MCYPLNPSDSISTTCFNILKLCNLPTACICVFRIVSRKISTVSLKALADW
jgi:hypothetical protein